MATTLFSDNFPVDSQEMKRDEWSHETDNSSEQCFNIFFSRIIRVNIPLNKQSVEEGRSSVHLDVSKEPSPRTLVKDCKEIKSSGATSSVSIN